MPRHVRITLATLPFFAVAALCAQTPAADSAEVVRVVNAYHTALAKGDSAAALALLADDVVVLESGGMESRDQYRARHLPADMQFAQAVPRTPSAMAARVRGDVAWTWSTSVTEGEFRGRPVNSTGAELMVLVRTPQGWRISTIHWSSRARRQ